MARYLYINPDPSTQSRATQLGCGWVAVPPSDLAAAVEGKTPCAVVSGGGIVAVVSEPTTTQAVALAAQPIINAEAALQAAATTQQANRDTLTARAQAALAANDSFLALASPTQAQTLAEVKALARQNNGIIRLLLGLFDDVSDT